MSVASAIEAIARTYHRRTAILDFFVENSLLIIVMSFLAVYMANQNTEWYHHLVHFKPSTMFLAPALVLLALMASFGLVMKEETESRHETSHFKQGTKVVLIFLVLLEWLIVPAWFFAWDVHFVVVGWLFMIFFAIASKEIKEALSKGGPLSNPRARWLIGFVTAGGVIVPAVLYILVADPSLRSDGWAVPSPTDIALATTIMVLGPYKRIDHPAVLFLLTVAVLDDLIGISIIATWYTRPEISDIAVAAVLFAAAIGTQWRLRSDRVDNFLAYLAVPGQLAWWGCYIVGVEPAIALVPVVFFMPGAPHDHGMFETSESEWNHTDSLNVMRRVLKVPVEVILGAFALVSAGVVFNSNSLGEGFLPTATGLWIGKPVGMILGAAIGVVLFRLSLPKGVTWRDVVVSGIFGGIGFTVSLFITETAFTDEAIISSHKFGAMVGSIFSIFNGLLAAWLLGVWDRGDGEINKDNILDEAYEVFRLSN